MRFGQEFVHSQLDVNTECTVRPADSGPEGLRTFLRGGKFTYLLGQQQTMNQLPGN